MIKELKELRSMSNEDLLKELDNLRAEYRNLMTKIATGGAVEKPARARNIRRRIARILTILREREVKKHAIAR
ncbi:MAG: 50S ribosomal protein L29 [Nitrososphaerota archaeon]|nr:50S ribosomal protein L29 [Aigarchaeota archaeon]MDW8076260.1 50S ribosomal protein L29 [Nitrososphaerota archaeon]